MLYTQSEKRQFEDTISRFNFMYQALIRQMEAVYKAKAAERDVDTPLHHRMSPLYMLSVIQAKSRRLDSMMTRKEWELDEHLRDRVVEEALDVANYSLYVASFCWLIDDNEGIAHPEGSVISHTTANADPYALETVHGRLAKMTEELVASPFIKPRSATVQVDEEAMRAMHAKLADAAKTAQELPAKMGIRGNEVILRFENEDVSMGTYDETTLKEIRSFISALGQEQGE